jgi:TIR domain
MQIFDPDQLLPVDKRYDFFISYSHKDKEIALDLYYLSVANGLEPWLDDRHLTYVDEVTERALQGIHNSKQFLVIISPESKSSTPVKKEIEEALSVHNDRKGTESEFNITAYPINGTSVPDCLKNFLYVEDRADHPQPAALKLIQKITGRDMFGTYMHGAYAGLLSAGIAPTPGHSKGLFNAYSHVVLTQITSILSDTARGLHPNETLSTIQYLVNTSNLFQVVPISQTWIALGNGIFESIHPARMSKTPEIKVLDLPPDIAFIECENNPVVTRLHFVWKGTNEPVLTPFPFRIALDAG